MSKEEDTLKFVVTNGAGLALILRRLAIELHVPIEQANSFAAGLCFGLWQHAPVVIKLSDDHILRTRREDWIDALKVLTSPDHAAELWAWANLGQIYPDFTDHGPE